MHVAIYDFRLRDAHVAKQVVDALAERADAGLEVRIAYDHRNEPEFGIGDDPKPHGTHEFVTKRFDEGGPPAGGLVEDTKKNVPAGWNEVAKVETIVAKRGISSAPAAIPEPGRRQALRRERGH